VKILGLDPGLGTTGWGLIEAQGNRLSHVANGEFSTRTADPLPARLVQIAHELEALLAAHSPDTTAVEEVFVNKNPQSTLKLGQARGVALLVPGQAGVSVALNRPGFAGGRLV
jgi:crossover junction endodeoxyribonuclease RuvC